MFLKKNIKKIRSFSATLGIAAAVLLSGAATGAAQTQQGKLNDFQGNGRTSFTTLGFPAAGSGLPITWRITGNPSSAAPNAAFKREFNYGIADSDDPAVGDYTGDNKSEVTVYRSDAASTAGTFYVSQFPTGTGGITLERAVRFGTSTDIAGVQGDYDGDGKHDYTVVRVNSAGTLVWYIMGSTTGTMKAIPFGTVVGIPSTSGATVFPGADFNGDGRDELIYVTRNEAGTQVNYFIGDANTGAGVITRTFGNYNTDSSLAPDDYTGDGRADFVAVRQTDGAQSTWYIQSTSATGAVTTTATRFGIADPAFIDGDLPVRGDYDGDGRHDICVWRSSNQVFYYISSQNGSVQGQKAGNSTDFPLGSFGVY